MNDDTGDSGNGRLRRQGSRFSEMPKSKAGRWAVGLEAAFVALFSLNMVGYWARMLQSAVQGGVGETPPPWIMVLIPISWIAFACGVAGGMLGIIAIVRGRERSVLLWLAALPAAFAVVFLLGEFLVPH